MNEKKLSRRKMRKAAFLLVFEREFLPDVPAEELFNRADEMFSQAEGGDLAELKLDRAAKELFLGVEARREEIDETISHYLKGWTLSRISKVSLAVLRVACYELMTYAGEDENQVPADVIISEAVQIAQQYTAPEDVSFINGVLARMNREAK